MKWIALALGAVALAGCELAPNTNGEDPASDDSAIVGGVAASDYPEAATVNFTKNGKKYVCSGAVIAPTVVLTAGHCVSGGASNFTIGANGVTTTGTSTKVLDYTDGSDAVNFQEHDVALIFLADPITLTTYPSIATAPVANGTKLVNVGRVDDGVQTKNLYEATTTVTLPPLAPYDYTSSRVIQPGDSGGPDFISGTHTIAAVNSGASNTDTSQYLARVDQAHDFIVAAIAANGGGGGAPTSGVIPNDTLTSTTNYQVVASTLNCRSGAGTSNAVVTQLTAGDAVTTDMTVQTASDGTPWLEIQPPTGDACYVSANYSFITPSTTP